LHIPVFRTVPERIPEDFFFILRFPEDFSQECVFGGVTGILFFSDFTGIFRRNSCGQEFLHLLRIPEDSFSRRKQSGSGQRLKKALCYVKYRLK